MKEQILVCKLSAFTALLLLLLATNAWAGLTPDSTYAMLAPGESFAEAKTATVEGVIPKGDIMFSFDLTGSMWDEITVAKASATDIMNEIDLLVSDAQYGVISYMDYDGFFSSCGYSNWYGSSGDYPYNLDEPLTSVKADVAASINSLPLGSGADGPQDYTRIFYESYSDPAIGYRVGSKKILVNFGDAVPHDCNLNQGVPGTSGTWTTGADPGRDEVIGTADDLDLQTVLADMVANNITLLEIHGNTYYGGLEYWEHWTSLTGGNLYHLGTAADIPQAIKELIKAEATFISVLTLEICTPGFESWLASVDPPQYTDVEAPAALPFDVVMTVPEDTPDGIYCFTLCLVGDGAVFGEQVVCVEVKSTIEVALDIKPQSCPNPLNVRAPKDYSWTEADESSMAAKAPPGGIQQVRAVLPVAILGTADFNVADIDPATVMLEGVPALRWNIEDVSTPVGEEAEECECNALGADGYDDLTLKFDRSLIIGALGEVYNGDTVSLMISGELSDGVAIEGTDCVVIRGAGEPAAGAPPSGESPSVTLLGNYPNPFNPATEISFSLPSASHVKLEIFNVMGQKVATLVNGQFEAGEHVVQWDGSKAASGVYFYRLQADNFVGTKKMLLLK